MRVCRIGLLVSALTLDFAAGALAQGPSDLHGTLIGFGLLLQTNDAANRLHEVDQRTHLVPSPPVRPMPHAEVGFRITPGLGFDLAVTRIQSVSGLPTSCSIGTAPCTGVIEEREQETLIHGLLRGRLRRRGRTAFDVLGGGGITVEHAMGTLNTCFPGGTGNSFRLLAFCSHTAASSFRLSPSFAGGFDVPVVIGNRIEISPVFRVMYLGRGHLESESEFRDSSVKAELGVAIRGRW